MERLQKYLARCGVASRRAAEQLISAGRISVNGRPVLELGTKVDADVDQVTVDGRVVSPVTDKVYVMANKPIGTVTTTSDPWGRRTILDMVPRIARLFPVGRLDADSEGLVLLTNDGELANLVTHPRYGCEKEYRVLVRGEITPEIVEALRNGVDLPEARTSPAAVEVGSTGRDRTRWLKVVLREGRKRQVRRMLAHFGLGVERLQRVRIGPLLLGSLPTGQSRPLSRTEVDALYASVR